MLEWTGEHNNTKYQNTKINNMDNSRILSLVKESLLIKSILAYSALEEVGVLLYNKVLQ